MSGPLPITYCEIDAFQRVTATQLAGWELEAIKKTDAAFLSDWYERQPKPTP